MKKQLFILFFWWLPFMALAQEPVLVIDRIQGSESITKQFRKDLSAQLRASASGQFSAKELQNILCNIPAPVENIWIVDLRRESHGFINGIAVSWYGEKNQANKDATPVQIAQREKALLQQLAVQKSVVVYHLKKLNDGEIGVYDPITIQPETVQSEKQLVENLGAKYQRLYVLDHHKPDDETVDLFVDFFTKHISSNDWVHFHCRGGKGRSSEFVAMFDMLKNAKVDSFSTIMQRQVAMGNKDLAPADLEKGKEWKYGPATERYDFLKRFYAYAASDNGYPKHSWSSWLHADQ